MMASFSPRHKRGTLAPLALAAVGLTLGCFESSPGPGWMIPADVQLAGASIVEYDAAPAWDEGAHCAGSLMPGAAELGERLQAMFPEIAHVGGYDCRPNTAFPNELSVHGTGRALDLAIPMRDGEADNARGDPVANWLVEHSAELGVQLIIWDRTIWLGNQPRLPKERPYTGPDPHVDHIHVELTEEAAL